MKPLLIALAFALLAPPARAQDRSIGTTPDEITYTQLHRLGTGTILHGDPSRRRPYVVRLQPPPTPSSPRTATLARRASPSYRASSASARARSSTRPGAACCPPARSITCPPAPGISPGPAPRAR